MRPTVEDEMDEDYDAEEENKLINEVSSVELVLSLWGSEERIVLCRNTKSGEHHTKRNCLIGC